MVADFYAVPAGRQPAIEEYRPETVSGVELNDVFVRPLMTTCLLSLLSADMKLSTQAQMLYNRAAQREASKCH